MLSDKEAAHHHWHFFCNVPSASMPGDRREREKGRSGKVCPFPADDCVCWCVSRYGLPVNFQAMLLQPNRKSVKRLRDVLNVVFKHLDEVAAASIMDVCIWTASAHALACLSLDNPGARACISSHFTLRGALDAPLMAPVVTDWIRATGRLRWWWRCVEIA